MDQCGVFIVPSLQIVPSAGVLYFKVPDDVMVERLLNRAKTSGRVDDNEETIKKRLATFHKHTEPVIEYYKKKCVTVPATGTAEEIFASVVRYMSPGENKFSPRDAYVFN